MNAQETFDTVVNHLIKQGRRSVISLNDPLRGPFKQCAYRTPEGLKCAAGILIPDELYSPRMEMSNVFSVVRKWPEVREHFGDVDVLYELQTVHDNVASWDENGLSPIGRLKLNDVASKFSLSPDVLYR